MKVGTIPENPVEWLLKKINVIPTPLLDTLQATLLARSIMVGTKLGVFEAVADAPRSAEEIARRIGADPRAAEKLLNALVGGGYLRYRDGRYSIASVARKWLLATSPISLRDNMLHRFLEWEAIERFEEFVRTGEPLSIHDEMPPEYWETYQRGMRSVAALSAGEVARRVSVPRDARTMIDIGGSHGLYAVAICRRHPRLAATVLDLPAAVERAAPLLAQEEMGDRVVHRAGNALTEDLGEKAWDLVFVSQLVHHFDDATNRELARRIARALRPDGVFAILEFVRPKSPERAGQTGGLLDLFFAVTSESGTWSIEELREWQQEAGLVPRKSIGLLSAPGARIQAATKPRSSVARSRPPRSGVDSSRTAGGSRLAGPQHEASSGGAL